MNDDERKFKCPKCQLRIGTIEADGVLVMYPGIRIARADFVCVCGKALYWHSHEMAMDRLVDRVRRMRSEASVQQTQSSGTGSPRGMLS